MNFWVVAAGACAGYLAKYWQNIVKDNEGSRRTCSGSVFADEPESPSLIQRIRDKACPISKLSRVKGSGRHFNDTGKGYHRGETSERDGETNCISVSDHAKQFERFEDGNVPSLSMSRVYRDHEIIEDYRDGYALDGDMGDVPEHSTWEMGASQGSRSKKSVRSKRLHLQYIKSRTLDSCLLVQMNRADAELEEYLSSPLASPCTSSLRPFLVTDGKRIISRARAEVRGGLDNGDRRRTDNQVVGVAHQTQISTSDYSKLKIKTGANQMTKSHYISKLMQFDAQEGSSSDQALFFLGIYIGMIWTIESNMMELEKLKAQLKQSDNLVEDLQEELEMKDSLTVKELANDDDSQDIHESSSSIEKINLFPNQANTKVLLSYADDKLKSPKKDESISGIEAELEAELERLELSMKKSTLEGTLLDNEEFCLPMKLDQGFDEDIIAELVHGELQAELVRGQLSSERTLDRGSDRSPTPHSIRNGVSHRELSLRLHEVIQLRLEKRLMELEEELVQSKRRIKQLESERINNCREVSNSDSSSSRCSRRAIEASMPIVQPLVMNLSGDALDAYNYAFDELNKLEGSENEYSQVLVDSKQDNLFQSNQGINGRQSGFPNGHTPWLPSNREEALPISITGIPSSEDSPNYCYHDDYDIDRDLLLIKQIVEKARQGSPAILKAQRAMVSLDRDK